MNADSFLNKLAGTSGVCLLLTVCLLTACGQGSQKPAPKQQSAQQQQQSEKEPQKLKDIETSIEEVEKELGGPSAPISGEKQEGGQQQGQQGQQQSQPKDPWKAVSSTIDKLHFQWNEFMPEAIKKGASRKIVESFGNSLNTLTTTVATKDKSKTLLDANGLYGCVPDLYSLYRTKMSPEIKRMHYLVRNIILTSETGAWAQAEKDMNELKASWTVSKGSLGKEHEKDQGKLDMSIAELEKVVKEKNQQLTAIKGKVSLTNIQAVEKSYEKESGKSGGGGGQTS